MFEIVLTIWLSLEMFDTDQSAPGTAVLNSRVDTIFFFLKRLFVSFAKMITSFVDGWHLELLGGGQSGYGYLPADTKN